MCLEVFIENEKNIKHQKGKFIPMIKLLIRALIEVSMIPDSEI